MRSAFDIAARIGAGQQGRVACRQLLAEGVDRHRIRRWLADGRLHPLHEGVYAVGHPGRSVLGDYMAAVLACGPGAVLSHRAAAHLLQLLPGDPPPPEVTVPTIAGRRRPGIVVHRVRALEPRDLSEYEHIAITIVPRILLDLAPALTGPALTRACHEAWVKHDVSPRAIDACIVRNPRKKGAKKLRLAVGADVTLSALEDGFLELLRNHELEPPRTNIDVAGDRVDCHWPQHGLTIELLSHRFHATRKAFESDVARRRRTNHIAFTYGDVFERGPQTAAEIARLLR